MAKRDASQIYADLVAAGFSAASATTMTAIALAESGGDDTVLGDQGLANATWGPSYGLYQIRTLKADTGRGTDRDISWLAGSSKNQALAALHISNGGTSFTPWTMYTNGRYQDYMGQAQAAATGVGGASVTGVSGILPGPDWMYGPLPLWMQGQVDGAKSSAVLGARNIVIEGVAVMLGLGLVVLGLSRGFAERSRRKMTQVREVTKDVLT